MFKYLRFSFIKKLLKDEIENSSKFDNFLNTHYLFDFKNYQSGFNNNSIDIDMVMDSTEDVSSSESSKQNKIKLFIKPIDVLDELEKIPTPFSLECLDEKLEILKQKEALIVQKYAKREVIALIERLENRKKYLEFKTFFDRFQNTNDEAIEKLLSKYDLVMKTSDLFIPEFPDDAVKVIQEYNTMCEKICNKKPLYYVIAEPDKFRKAYEKRDPILLVQSPFGFYWQILGAWDKEMILLSEL